MIATWIQHQVVIKYCTFNHMHIDTHAMFAISVMDREDTFPITYRCVLQWKTQHCKLELFTEAISVIKLERKSSLSKLALTETHQAACHLWYWPIIFSRLCYDFLTSVSGNSLKRNYNDSFSYNGSPVGCELWSLCWWLKATRYLYPDFYCRKALLSCICLYKNLAVWLHWDPGARGAAAH